MRISDIEETNTLFNLYTEMSHEKKNRFLLKYSSVRCRTMCLPRQFCIYQYI